MEIATLISTSLYGGFDDRDIAETLRYLERRAEFCFCAYIGSSASELELAGVITGTHTKLDRASLIDFLVVEENNRRQKIGAHLLHTVAKYHVESGYTGQIVLDCRDDGRGQEAFYRRCGMLPSGSRDVNGTILSVSMVAAAKKIVRHTAAILDQKPA